MPGSCTKACPGFEVHVFNDNNEDLPKKFEKDENGEEKEVCTDEVGKIVIKLPLPPGFSHPTCDSKAKYVEEFLS